MSRVYSGFIPVAPIPCPRPRIAVRGRGHAYYPKAYKDWQSEVIKHLPDLDADEAIDRPCRVKLRFVVPKPRATKLHTPKGDIDNYVKAALDAITSAGLWADDTLVWSLTAEKVFDGEDAPFGIYYFIEAI